MNLLLKYISNVVRKTSDTILELADSKLVKKASEIGSDVAKKGVEGAAGVANKTIKKGKEVAQKVKNIDKEKIGHQIEEVAGKVTNKTLVGLDEDYVPIGKSKDGSGIGIRGSKDKSRPKTEYVGTTKTLGVLDAVTDRARLYMDGMAHIAKGDSYLTGKKPLFTTGADNYLPAGLKVTKAAGAIYAGASLVGAIPGAAKQ